MITESFYTREFLETVESGSTAIITAFHGPVKYDIGRSSRLREQDNTFLSISDCHSTVRLHINNGDATAFVAKLRLIQETTKALADHLEKVNYQGCKP